MFINAVMIRQVCKQNSISVSQTCYSFMWIENSTVLSVRPVLKGGIGLSFSELHEANKIFNAIQANYPLLLTNWGQHSEMFVQFHKENVLSPKNLGPFS